MSKTNLICIVGPTASGKTALGVRLAKELNGEIVSADSMQVYKGMPIASAVPTKEEMCEIPHHLIEFLEPDTQLTVADYTKSAHEKIADIVSRGKLPILVGGTGLYVDSLVNNLTFTNEKTNSTVREKYEKMYDEIGKEEMHKRLGAFDKESAERISPNDKKRLVRAFEIFENSGITMTEQYELSKEIPSPYNVLYIGINYKDRQKLYDRINLRVDVMAQNGLIEEAEKTFRKNAQKLGGFMAIGHKELFPYFEKEISKEEALENLKRQTRRYAKRQLTWFNKNEKINWVYPDFDENAFDKASEIAKEFSENN